jgi:hypothetical protein
MIPFGKIPARYFKPCGISAADQGSGKEGSRCLNYSMESCKHPDFELWQNYSSGYPIYARWIQP